MRLYIYSILILFFSIGANAQSSSDTIQFAKILSSVENKKEIKNADIDKALKITDKTRIEHPDFTLYHLKKIRKSIEKNKHYKAFPHYAKQIVFIYSGKSEIKKAEKILNEIYNKNEDLLDRHTKSSLKFQFASIASSLGELEKSQRILNEILPDADSTILRAGIYFQKGKNLDDLGNYKEALSNSLKAVDLYKSVGDKNYLTVALDLINVIYQHLGDYDNALIYSKKALAIAVEEKNVEAMMTSYSNMGVIYKVKAQTDSAVWVYNKVIEMAEKYDRPFIKAQNLLNLGNIKTDSGKFQEAEEYFLQSLEICNDLNIAEGIVMNYINLGYNQLMAKNYSKSETYYKNALEESGKLQGNPYFKTHIYDGLANLFEVKGDYKNALVNHKKSQELKDEINIEQSKKDIAEIQGKYDTAIKDAEIEKINNEYEIKKSEVQTLIALIIFSVILAAGWVLFLTARNKQLKVLYKKNVELLNSKQFITPEAEEADAEQNDPLKGIFDEIIYVLETEKIYQNPNLSINDVTQAINSNQKYVSSAITTYSNMNFNNFINYYRINEAKKLIIYHKQHTLNEIMYASGFNSRTPFYNAFIKFTGMSPKKFKDLSRNNEIETKVEYLQEAI